MILIYFDDYHHDGMDKVVEASEEEWQELIEPAVRKKFPIDAATVDAKTFNKLYDRPDQDLKNSEIKKITRVVPLV